MHTIGSLRPRDYPTCCRIAAHGRAAKARLYARPRCLSTPFPVTAFARCLAITLAFSPVGSLLVPRGWLRTFATLIAVPTLILWLLAGLMKVVSHLA